MARFPLLSDVLAARRRLRGVALHTPLERSPTLADESGSTERQPRRPFADESCSPSTSRPLILVSDGATRRRDGSPRAVEAALFATQSARGVLMVRIFLEASTWAPSKRCAVNGRPWSRELLSQSRSARSRIRVACGEPSPPSGEVSPHGRRSAARPALRIRRGDVTSREQSRAVTPSHHTADSRGDSV